MLVYTSCKNIVEFDGAAASSFPIILLTSISMAELDIGVKIPCLYFLELMVCTPKEAFEVFTGFIVWRFYFPFLHPFVVQ